MEQSSSNILTMKMCRCGRAPFRKSGRNCYLCNREANKRYRASLKGPLELAKSIRASEAQNGQEGFVYFIRSGERGLIKIGFSVDPWGRMRQLQTGSPFQLFFLGAVSARRVMEKMFHTRFAAYRHNGEWFEPAKEIHDFIEEMMETNTSGSEANTG